MTILENLVRYISLLRNHIHREDYKFYPMVKETLSEDEMRNLLELFAKEEERAGGKTFEDGQKLVEEMAALS